MKNLLKTHENLVIFPLKYSQDFNGFWFPSARRELVDPFPPFESFGLPVHYPNSKNQGEQETHRKDKKKPFGGAPRQALHAIKNLNRIKWFFLSLY